MDLKRYTEKAQEALVQAQSLAGEYSHGQIEGEHLLLHASGGVETVRTDQRNASNDTVGSFVMGRVDHPTTALRARSPSPMGWLFASPSVPWRSISSWVIWVRRLPNSRSASGSRKLRLAPRST